MWRHLNKKGKNKVIYTNQTVVFSPPAWDEPKVRFWNKPPPPSSLINPLTSTLLLSLHVMTNCPPRHKKMLLPAEWCSLALSACPFRPLFLIYLCLFFLFSMKMIVPLSSADAAVIEKHTLLRPLSLSLSLPDSHWLPVRGDITLPFLPASLPPPPLFPPITLLTSLLVDSGHSFIVPLCPPLSPSTRSGLKGPAALFTVLVFTWAVPGIIIIEEIAYGSPALVLPAPFQRLIDYRVK